jgi:hypothetical protein
MAVNMYIMYIYKIKLIALCLITFKNDTLYCIEKDDSLRLKFSLFAISWVRMFFHLSNTQSKDVTLGITLFPL